MKGHRVISIRPEDVSLSSRSLRELRVETRYVDEAGGLSFADELRFGAQADGTGPGPQLFEYDYLAADRSAFEYRVKYIHTNGLTRSTDWQSCDADELVIPVGA
jgi:hypothetical protein